MRVSLSTVFLFVIAVAVMGHRTWETACVFIKKTENVNKGHRTLQCSVRKCSQKFCKETLAQVFSYEFCKISKNTFSNRTPPVATSVKSSMKSTKRFSQKNLHHIFDRIIQLIFSVSLFSFCFLCYLIASYFPCKMKLREIFTHRLVLLSCFHFEPYFLQFEISEI